MDGVTPARRARAAGDAGRCRHRPGHLSGRRLRLCHPVADAAGGGEPREVLRQMLRIGKRAIVASRISAIGRCGCNCCCNGRMPMTKTWSRMWYETPNIHPCTIEDFFHLCAADGYKVEQWLAADEAGAQHAVAPLAGLWPIWFGEQGLFLLRKA